MKSMRVGVLIALQLIAYIFLFGQPSFAFQVSTADRYTLPAQDTIPDDLYLVCGGARFSFAGSENHSPGGAFIDGTILGDIALAGGAYHLAGNVSGNLSSASQRATVTGMIDKSARIAGELVTIDGQIQRDAIIFANEVELGTSSIVGQDVSVMGNEVSLNGTIGRNVYIRADQVIISGKIGGNLHIRANSISIVSPAEIVGDISYASPKKIKIDDDVSVAGKVDWEKIEAEKKETDKNNDWGFALILFFCSLTTGLVIIPLFRKHTDLSVQQVLTQPLPSLGLGFVALFAAPFAIALLAITIVGIPLSLILLFTYTVFFYIAKIYTAIALGHIVINAFRKNVTVRTGWAFVLGLVLLSIFFKLPYIGWLVYLLTIFFGLGALLRGIFQCRREAIDSGTPAPDVSSMS